MLRTRDPTRTKPHPRPLRTPADAPWTHGAHHNYRAPHPLWSRPMRPLTRLAATCATTAALLLTGTATASATTASTPAAPDRTP